MGTSGEDWERSQGTEVGDEVADCRCGALLTAIACQLRQNIILELELQ